MKIPFSPRPRSTACRWACAIAGTACACLAHAQEAPEPCAIPPVPLGQAFGDRPGTIVKMEALPEQCLKIIFRDCSEQADRAVLDLGSAAVCSMGYEALLRKTFSGDFGALMAWWRGERDLAPPARR